MGIITRMRRQSCVYWEPTGQLSKNNDPIYADPVQMTCRWVEVNELFLDSNGKEQVSNAKVYTELDVKLDGYLMLGTLDDLVTNNPLDNTGIHKIRKFTKLPNLRVTEYLRTAML